MPRDMLSEAPVETAPVDLAKIDTLHELLALAINDAEKTMLDPRYYPDMNFYHHQNPWHDGLCAVCLAGSVIAKTLEAPHTAELDPSDFPDPIQERLFALDALRSGYTATAWQIIHHETAPSRAFELEEGWVEILRRLGEASGPEETRRLLPYLRELQSDLQEAGL